MASPIRLNPVLIAAAEREGAVQKRSTPKQIEYWAELGRIIAHEIDLADVFAVTQGLKKIKLASEKSLAVKPEDVFASLENDRKQGSLSQKVTTSVVYYEASKRKPGLLDKVDTVTGERQTGQFQDGKFKLHG